MLVNTMGQATLNAEIKNLLEYYQYKIGHDVSGYSSERLHDLIL